MKSKKRSKIKRISMSFTAVILSLCLVCGVLAACSLSEVTYIKLDKTEISLYVGDTATVKAETDKEGTEIVWSSDATHIATVDGGVITAVAAGEATVKARCGKVRAFCEVTVSEKPNESDPTPDPTPDPDPTPTPTPDPTPDPEPTPTPEPVTEGNLCEVYGDYFAVGAAVQTSKLTSGSYGELMKHFNSITPENNMKWKNLEPSKGVYNFNQSGDSADKLIAWAKSNNTKVRGHCLLWYKSLPSWLHDEFDGQSYSESLRNKALSYIDEHIETVMEHFGDDVYVWDVCNEALFNSVSESNLAVSAQNPYGNIWRTNDNMSASDSDWVDWYKVCGGYDYIAEAFKKADEVRKANNLDLELYYNDYSLNNPYKRQACLNLVQMLRDNSAPIDGIGMQAHYKLDDYTANKALWIKNFEDSIKAFVEAGLDVQITELDIRFDGELTTEREKDQAEMYGEIFRVCRKYAKTDGVAHGVTGVTTWGVYDGCNTAWGKDMYPLVFGTDKLPKKAYYEIIDF